MRYFDLDRVWRFLPLLVGELVVGTTALAAITLTIDEPLWKFTIHAALVAGLAFTLLNVATQRRHAWPGTIIFLVAFAFYAGRQYLGPAVALFFPPEVTGQQDILLAGLVGWFLVAFACWQANRRNLIFMVVCGLAIFGLMGTVNLNAELLIAFAVFMCAAVFCWGYEQYLEMDDRLAAQGQSHAAPWLEVARGQLSVALLVGLLTFAVGSLIGAGAYRVSPNLYATMANHAYGWKMPATARKAFSSFEPSFRIGDGPVHLLDVPVMQIEADHASVWRGEVYDVYDGSQWRHGPDRHYSLETAPDGGLQVPTIILPPEGSYTTNRQHVHILNAPGLIFASAQPAWMNFAPNPPGPGMMPLRLAYPVVDSAGCLSWSGGDYSGVTEYVVTSREPLTAPARLRQCSADYSDPGFEPYLQVPAQTALLLQPLVQNLTANATTPYDKVAALKAYLEKTCVYTLNARAVPSGADAVDYFVNHSRRGACDLFSSSLAILSRLAGVPARVATGYASGAYDAENGYFVVKGTDAHAWTEIYFHGYGWVPFDPQATTNYDEQTIAQLFTGGHVGLALGEVMHRVVVGVLLIALLVLALSALIDPLDLLRRITRQPEQTPLARLCAQYQALYTLLQRRAGLELSPALTPQEAMAAVVEALPRRIRLDRRRLLALNQSFYAVRYSDDAPYAELTKLRDELTAIRRKLGRQR